MSTHAFLVNAIETSTEAEESRLRMLNRAKRALVKSRKTGKGYAANEVHEYIRDRVKGKKPEKPQEVAIWQD